MFSSYAADRSAVIASNLVAMPVGKIHVHNHWSSSEGIS